MGQTDGSHRVYRYYRSRWLLPLFAGIWSGTIVAVSVWSLVALGVAEIDFSVPKVSAAVGGLILVLNTTLMLIEPFEFVLRERTFKIRWLWREHEVPTETLAIMEPPDSPPKPKLCLMYDNRKIHINLNLGDFGDLRTTLLSRGAQFEPEKVVTVLGADEDCTKVSLMLLLKDRAHMDQTAARDEAIRILKGERVSLRLESTIDARQLRKELHEMGVCVQNEDTV